MLENIHAQSNRQDLAMQILELTRDTLLVSLRFLNTALGQLPFREAERSELATDGSQLLFGSQNVAQCFRQSREQVNRDYLHVLLHLVLLHPFASLRTRPDYWNLACDLAVEAIIDELNLVQTNCPGFASRKAILEPLKKSARSLTADRLYRFFLDQALPEETVLSWHELFWRDDHHPWPCYTDAEFPDTIIDQDDRTSPSPDITVQNDRKAAKERWETISERVQVDLETVSQHWAEQSGTLTAAIERANQPRIDYQSFLRRFMVLGETMRINDDEFDLVFYTYGLARYHNLPLIEPLEYKDTPGIRDLVIALDTSGSCSGDLVQAFVRKTGALLSQDDAFFSSFNVYLIQCDAAVQSVTHLSKPEDFASFTANGQLSGFGGTDFRPVFRWVDEMIVQKQLTQLKGLIYFTDGQGVFPEKKPDFETAFIFLSDEGSQVTVPPWAIKLILHEEDLERL